VSWGCPWITSPAPPVDPASVHGLIEELTALELDSAVLLTSFHQSPLPLALLLRMARVPQIAAASVDYPGSLLDVRVRPGSAPSTGTSTGTSPATSAGTSPAIDDAAAVVPMPGARDALNLVRRAGLRTGVVSNQSGIGRGMLRREQVDSVNARVEELLGPFDVWRICPHTAADGCLCRKPAPGMVLSAADELGIDPARLVVIGDIGADVGAARAAGARAVLVPTPVTRPEEVDAAPEVAPDIWTAVTRLVAELDLTGQ